MNVDFSKTFDRHFHSRLTNLQRVRALDAINLFIDNPFHTDLRNHALQGKWQGYRSISIGGDLRLHFQETASDRVLFVAAGNHEQLYK